MMDKSTLRTKYRSIREGLSREGVADASAKLCRELSRMALLQEAEVVMAYLAFGNELSLDALFPLLPEIDWVVPRIEGRRLILHRYAPHALDRHPFGMLEPPPDAPEVAPEQLDIVLVPGVAFDRCGARLGFGGGFYDRLLVRTPAIRVGIGHESCLAAELPSYEHDQRMDWVVTPTFAIHAAPLWRRESERPRWTGRLC